MAWLEWLGARLAVRLADGLDGAGTRPAAAPPAITPAQRQALDKVETAVTTTTDAAAVEQYRRELQDQFKTSTPAGSTQGQAIRDELQVLDRALTQIETAAQANQPVPPELIAHLRDHAARVESLLQQGTGSRPDDPQRINSLKPAEARAELARLTTAGVSDGNAGLAAMLAYRGQGYEVANPGAAPAGFAFSASKTVNGEPVKIDVSLDTRNAGDGVALRQSGAVSSEFSAGSLQELFGPGQARPQGVMGNILDLTRASLGEARDPTQQPVVTTAAELLRALKTADPERAATCDALLQDLAAGPADTNAWLDQAQATIARAPVGQRGQALVTALEDNTQHLRQLTPQATADAIAGWQANRERLDQAAARYNQAVAAGADPTPALADLYAAMGDAAAQGKAPGEMVEAQIPGLGKLQLPRADAEQRGQQIGAHVQAEQDLARTNHDVQQRLAAALDKAGPPSDPAQQEVLARLRQGQLSPDETLRLLQGVGSDAGGADVRALTDAIGRRDAARAGMAQELGRLCDPRGYLPLIADPTLRQGYDQLDAQKRELVALCQQSPALGPYLAARAGAQQEAAQMPAGTFVRAADLGLDGAARDFGFVGPAQAARTDFGHSSLGKLYGITDAIPGCELRSPDGNHSVFLSADGSLTVIRTGDQVEAISVERTAQGMTFRKQMSKVTPGEPPRLEHLSEQSGVVGEDKSFKTTSSIEHTPAGDVVRDWDPAQGKWYRTRAQIDGKEVTFLNPEVDYAKLAQAHGDLDLGVDAARLGQILRLQPNIGGGAESMYLVDGKVIVRKKIDNPSENDARTSTYEIGLQGDRVSVHAYDQMHKDRAAQIWNYDLGTKQGTFLAIGEDVHGQPFYRSGALGLDQARGTLAFGTLTQPQDVQMEATDWDGFKAGVSQSTLYNWVVQPVGKALGFVGGMVVRNTGAVITYVGAKAFGDNHGFATAMITAHAVIESGKALKVIPPEGILKTALAEIVDSEVRAQVVTVLEEDALHQIHEKEFRGMPWDQFVQDFNRSYPSDPKGPEGWSEARFKRLAPYIVEGGGANFGQRELKTMGTAGTVASYGLDFTITVGEMAACSYALKPLSALSRAAATTGYGQRAAAFLGQEINWATRIPLAGATIGEVAAYVPGATRAGNLAARVVGSSAADLAKMAPEQRAAVALEKLFTLPTHVPMQAGLIISSGLQAGDLVANPSLEHAYELGKNLASLVVFNQAGRMEQAQAQKAMLQEAVRELPSARQAEVLRAYEEVTREVAKETPEKAIEMLRARQTAAGRPGAEPGEVAATRRLLDIQIQAQVGKAIEQGFDAYDAARGKVQESARRLAQEGGLPPEQLAADATEVFRRTFAAELARGGSEAQARGRAELAGSEFAQVQKDLAGVQKQFPGNEAAQQQRIADLAREEARQAASPEVPPEAQARASARAELLLDASLSRFAAANGVSPGAVPALRQIMREALAQGTFNAEFMKGLKVLHEAGLATPELARAVGGASNPESAAWDLSKAIEAIPEQQRAAATDQLKMLADQGRLSEPVIKGLAAVAAGEGRGQLVRDVISDIADPGRICQGGKPTCSATRMQQVLAATDPARYAQAVAALASPSGDASGVIPGLKRAQSEAADASGAAITASGDRSASVTLVTDAFMELGRGLGATVAKDLPFLRPGKDGMLAPHEAGPLLDAVLGQQTAYRDRTEPPTPEDLARIEEQVKSIPDLGGRLEAKARLVKECWKDQVLADAKLGPVLVDMQWGRVRSNGEYEQGGHSVTFLGETTVKGQQYARIMNPQGEMQLIRAADFWAQYEGSYRLQDPRALSVPARYNSDQAYTTLDVNKYQVRPPGGSEATTPAATPADTPATNPTAGSAGGPAAAALDRVTDPVAKSEVKRLLAVTAQYNDPVRRQLELARVVDQGRGVGGTLSPVAAAVSEQLRIEYEAMPKYRLIREDGFVVEPGDARAGASAHAKTATIDVDGQPTQVFLKEYHPQEGQAAVQPSDYGYVMMEMEGARAFGSIMAPGPDGQPRPIGPRYYGPVDLGNGRIGLAFENLSAPPRNADLPEYMGHAITEQTFTDARAKVEALVKAGYSVGDLNFMVTAQGEFVFMDPGAVRRLPEGPGRAQAAADATRSMLSMVEGSLRLAQQRYQQQGPTTAPAPTFGTSREGTTPASVSGDAAEAKRIVDNALGNNPQSTPEDLATMRRFADQMRRNADPIEQRAATMLDGHLDRTADLRTARERLGQLVAELELPHPERVQDPAVQRALLDGVGQPRNAGHPNGEAGLLTPPQAEAAARALAGLSEGSYTRVQELLAAAGSDTERALILKALAAQRPVRVTDGDMTLELRGPVVEALALFARDIHGVPPERLRLQSTLADVGQGGLPQSLGTSCVPASVMVKLGEANPMFAWYARNGGAQAEGILGEVQRNWLEAWGQGNGVPVGTLARLEQTVDLARSLRDPLGGLPADQQNALRSCLNNDTLVDQGAAGAGLDQLAGGGRLTLMQAEALKKRFDDQPLSPPERALADQGMQRLQPLPADQHQALTDYLDGGALTPAAREALTRLQAHDPGLTDTVAAQLRGLQFARGMAMDDGFARSLTEFTGVPHRLYPAGKPVGGADVNALASALAGGHGALIGVEYDQGPKHALSVARVQGTEPNRRFEIHDTDYNRTAWVSEQSLLDGSFLLARTSDGTPGLDLAKGRLERMILPGEAPTASPATTDGQARFGSAAPAAPRLPPEKLALIEELQTKGTKFSPDQVVDVVRMPNGTLAFLEQGNNKAGLQHIVAAHAADFARRGVAQERIPELVMLALREGKPAGMQGRRPIYEVEFEGVKQYVAITVSSNGFVVGANPASAPE